MASYTERVVCRVIWYTFSMISFLTSLLTPLVIRRMKSWNGTLLLVVSLSWTLAIYSFGLLLTFADKHNVFCQLQGSLIYFSGISSALWTTCFSTTLLLLVIGVKFHGITQIYKYFFAVATGVPLVITCVGLSQGFISHEYLSCFVETEHLVFQDIYDITILVCVLYNLVFFAFCWYRIGRMGGANSASAKALKEACIRMMYYPIGQSCCWIFIWVSFFYDLGRKNQANPTAFVPLLLDCLSSPLFGFVMFLVFCLQQPRAFSALKDLVIPKCLRLWRRPASEALSDSLSESDDEGSSQGGSPKSGHKSILGPSMTQSDYLRRDAQRANNNNGSSKPPTPKGSREKPSQQSASMLVDLQDDLLEDEFIGLRIEDERDSHAIFRQSGSTVSRPTTISMVSRGSTNNGLSAALIDSRSTSVNGPPVAAAVATVAVPVKIDSVKSSTRKSVTIEEAPPSQPQEVASSPSAARTFSAAFLNLPARIFSTGGARTASQNSSRTNSRSTSHSSAGRTLSSASSRINRHGSRSISRDANFSHVEESDLFCMIQENTVYEDEDEERGGSSSGRFSTSTTATANKLLQAAAGGTSALDEEGGGGGSQQ